MGARQGSVCSVARGRDMARVADQMRGRALASGQRIWRRPGLVAPLGGLCAHYGLVPIVHCSPLGSSAPDTVHNRQGGKEILKIGQACYNGIHITQIPIRLVRLNVNTTAEIRLLYLWQQR